MQEGILQLLSIAMENITITEMQKAIKKRTLSLHVMCFMTRSALEMNKLMNLVKTKDTNLGKVEYCISLIV